MIQTGQNYIDKKAKEEVVTLVIDLHEYKFLAAIASRHKDTLRKLGINKNVSKKLGVSDSVIDDLVKDINIITNILGKSEVKT